MKSTASVETDATIFFAQIRRDAGAAVSSWARRFFELPWHSKRLQIPPAFLRNIIVQLRLSAGER